MLESLFTSKTKEQILLYITARNEGYAREIANYYKKSLSLVQSQLDKLEYGNILYSKRIGKTLMYYFNPRYTFLKELRLLLNKAFEFLPVQEKEKLINVRKRPRRKGKPL
jgi:DNA-binding transcriptional ArsR family regulator